MTWSFVFNMAWRDARTQWKQLLVFIGSILAGIAALVAILSFRADVLRTVDDQARELLGSDLEVEATQEFTEPVIAWMDSLETALNGRSIEMTEMTSMVLYGSEATPRLSRVRAVESDFPLYGKLTTDPAFAVQEFDSRDGAIVEQSYLRELLLQPGDTVQVGLLRLPIIAALIAVPGESDAFSLIGPRLYVPQHLIGESGLLQRGSRVEYKRQFAFQSGLDVVGEPDGSSDTSSNESSKSETAGVVIAGQSDRISDILREELDTQRPFLRSERVRTETVESRKEDFDEVIDGLSKFLGLIGFIALLLGGLGVGSSVYVYIRRRIPAIASLRCLGMRTSQLVGMFLIQILVLGLLGGGLGTLIGLAIQWALPMVLADFLPFSIAQGFTPEAVLLGLGTGLLISFSFALLPILSLTRISPLLALRVREVSPLKQLPKPVLFAGFTLTGILIILTLGGLLNSLLAGLFFTLGMLFSAGVLAGIAWLLMRGLHRLRLRSLPYEARQSLSNLYRPNNQSVLLMTTLGMGMLILGTMVLSRDIILQRIQFTVGEDQPNLVLYDIQQWQNEGVNARIQEAGYKPEQNVPIVTMRLSGLKGTAVREMIEDSTNEISRWALRREYRVTYRDSLNPAETLLAGEWLGTFEGDPFADAVPISVSDEIQEELDLELGDSLLFDVQGVPMQTTVASIRKVDFQRPEPNFFVLFPAGVLEAAPQFFATTVFVDSEEKKVALQSAIVAEFPNVSAIDISAVLTSVRGFLDKISIAVQFMAGFSIVTGLFVLGGALSTSRMQRIRESVLLRTLGAVGKQVRAILLMEVTLLGILAALTGLILSVGAGWALAIFFFDLPYVPEFSTLGGFAGGLVVLALVIGWLGSRSIISESPLQILREQAG